MGHNLTDWPEPTASTTHPGPALRHKPRPRNSGREVRPGPYSRRVGAKQSGRAICSHREERQMVQYPRRMVGSFDSVPDELLVRIFAYCSDRLAQLSTVSRRFRRVAFGHAPAILPPKICRLVIERPVESDRDDLRIIADYRRPRFPRHTHIGPTRQVFHKACGSGLVELLQRPQLSGCLQFYRLDFGSNDLLSTLISDRVDLSQMDAIRFTFCDFRSADLPKFDKLLAKLTTARLTVAFDYCHHVDEMLARVADVSNVSALTIRRRVGAPPPAAAARLNDANLRAWRANLRRLDLSDDHDTDFTLDGILSFIASLLSTREEVGNSRSVERDYHFGRIRLPCDVLLERQRGVAFAAGGRRLDAVLLAALRAPEEPSESATPLAFRVEPPCAASTCGARLTLVQAWPDPASSQAVTRQADSEDSEVARLFKDNFWLPKTRCPEHRSLRVQFVVKLHPSLFEES